MSIRAAFFDHDDRRTIAVRRWMIDATRDDDGDANLAAALMLAQVTFWTQPDERTGKVRAGHDHGDHAWLVRADAEWQEELGLSARAARRARHRLIALGWIESRTLVDGGVRCTHLRRLNQPAEPSTVRPKAEHAEAGSGHVQQPLLAETHAGASPPLSGEVVRDVPAGASAPERVEARAIVDAFWKWSKDTRGTEPTLAAHGAGSPFMALAKIVERLLAAGWSTPQVKAALVATSTYSVNALTLELNRAKGTGAKAGPRGAIDSDRGGPAGRVVAL